LYEGVIRHRRFSPRAHEFSYRVAMLYLRLDDIEDILGASPWWSASGRALGEFRRSDYLGDPNVSLDTAVRARVQQETGVAPTGPIYLLGNLRYFGFCINPIACYYCFDEAGDTLQYVVAEVTNTPWDERHSYVLAAPESGEVMRTQFDKEMHVSPFNPMNMRYEWRSKVPGEHLSVHIENWMTSDKVFDATLSLAARDLNRKSLDRMLWRYPFMTARVALAIYWQALKLFLKRAPIYAHPASNP
jgi:DUF1365 family protein